MIDLLLKVTNTGNEVLCEKCVLTGTKATASPQATAAAAATAAAVKNNQKSSPIKEIASSSPTKATAQQHMQSDSRSGGAMSGTDYDPNECAGCGDQLKEGQALIALERQWHIWCFR